MIPLRPARIGGDGRLRERQGFSVQFRDEKGYGRLIRPFRIQFDRDQPTKHFRPRQESGEQVSAGGMKRRSVGTQSRRDLSGIQSRKCLTRIPYFRECLGCIVNTSHGNLSRTLICQAS